MEKEGFWFKNPPQKCGWTALWAPPLDIFHKLVYLGGWGGGKLLLIQNPSFSTTTMKHYNISCNKIHILTELFSSLLLYLPTIFEISRTWTQNCEIFLSNTFTLDVNFIPYRITGIISSIIFFILLLVITLGFKLKIFNEKFVIKHNIFLYPFYPLHPLFSFF